MNVLLIGGRQHGLVLLFQLIEAFLGIGLLAGCVSTVSNI
jgi:hypothetical protein